MTSSIKIFGRVYRHLKKNLCKVSGNNAGEEAASFKTDILFEREILRNLQPVSPTDRVPSTGRLFSLRKIMYRGASFGSMGAHDVYILKII